jgi:hypothetical protein
VWHSTGKTWAFVATYSATGGYVLETSPRPRLRRVWENATGGSSPVVAGGLLYVFDPLGGGLLVYNPASGKRIARLDASPGHWNSPIVADGRIALPDGDANRHRANGALNIYRLAVK